jgi:hypothetical protein
MSRGLNPQVKALRHENKCPYFLSVLGILRNVKPEMKVPAIPNSKVVRSQLSPIPRFSGGVAGCGATEPPNLGGLPRSAELTPKPNPPQEVEDAGWFQVKQRKFWWVPLSRRSSLVS